MLNSNGNTTGKTMKMLKSTVDVRKKLKKKSLHIWIIESRDVTRFKNKKIKDVGEPAGPQIETIADMFDINSNAANSSFNGSIQSSSECLRCLISEIITD
uniref:Uncharacterized protein n=1 Tax=Bactrocera dorsalis TaxID=27457 RepID=A0A034WCM3_BACDO